MAADTTTPLTLKGRFIPLFDASQPLIHEYTVGAGARGLLVDLDRYPRSHIGVVAAACQVTNEKVTDSSITFDTIGQSQTNAVVSVLMPQAAQGVSIDGKPADASSFDYSEGVLRVRFSNRAETVAVSISR
jgi:hypothetical protein